MSIQKKHVPLTAEELGHLAGRLKLLGEPMRLKILQTVCHDSLAVNEIVNATGSTQANVSKHRALLAAGGILERKKAGQCVNYGVKDRLVLQLCELVRNQLNKEGKPAAAEATRLTMTAGGGSKSEVPRWRSQNIGDSGDRVGQPMLHREGLDRTECSGVRPGRIRAGQFGSGSESHTGQDCPTCHQQSLHRFQLPPIERAANFSGRG